MRGFLVVLVLAGSCAGCGGDSAPAGPGAEHWAKALRDPDARVRRKAALKLGNLGPADPAALPALIGALKDRDAGVRCEAILALVKFGRAAREAVPALEGARKDADARVRSYATRALAAIRGDDG